MNLSEAQNPATSDISSSLTTERLSHTSFRPKLILVLALFVCCGIVGGIWLYNYMTLQVPLDKLSVTDAKNAVVKVNAHYGGWVDFNTVVFDIKDLSGEASRLDVFRVLLQFAETQKGRQFQRVILAARGQNKFVIPGDYFQQLGQEYHTQNPMYTVRTFAPHVTAMDGSHPFGEYSGGILAVLGKEMEQFTEFHNEWYINDFVKAAK